MSQIQIKKIKALLTFRWGNHWVTGIDQADKMTTSLSHGGSNFYKDNKCCSWMKEMYEWGIAVICKLNTHSATVPPVTHADQTGAHRTAGARTFSLRLIYGGPWWQSNLGFNKRGYKWQQDWQHELCAVCAQLMNSINILLDGSWLNIWLIQIGSG